MTHTYALLEVSQATYDEISAKLRTAGYEHAFHKDGDDDDEVIDMHGLGLTRDKAERETGWVIADAGHTPRYRTMQQGVVAWAHDAREALRFARRRDAEMFSEEDDDAWRVLEI